MFEEFFNYKIISIQLFFDGSELFPKLTQSEIDKTSNYEMNI